MASILSIGGTGYIGKFIVEASVKAGHPTFVLVRESTVSGRCFESREFGEGDKTSGRGDIDSRSLRGALIEAIGSDLFASQFKEAGKPLRYRHKKVDVDGTQEVRYPSEYLKWMLMESDAA
ncbi:hypothetical protein CUMW_243670 [Citrus unshiu]|uniref:NmrA-like domain-containing protein n=1 Tax=Citrus unshiu TaxID=55188 RepID=A0A2H5QMD9_CITUN|nr:hypothetical protein CUMW_243670 [Citrus unshiu]